MRARPVLATVAVAAALLALPAAAHAQTDVHEDTSADVVALGADAWFTPEPDRTQTDVQRVRVGHGPGAVAVRIEALSLDPALVQMVDGRIRTPDGEARFSWVAKPSGVLRGRVVGPDGGRCRAEGRGSFDTTRGEVRVRVPRACLGDPAWVRVGVGLVTFDAPDELHLDDARATELQPEFVLGPRLRVG